jgi:PAS domain-containing protein
MFAALLALATDGIFVVQQGTIRECNDFLEARAGYRRAEVLETLFASFFDPASAAAVESLCRGRAVRRPAAAARLEVRLVAKNGRRLKGSLRTRGCRFGGRPAVLVVFSPAEKPPPPAIWEALPEAAWFPEEAAAETA